MRLSSIARLYRVRLRSRLVPELFAALGIAVGVSLLFASQVASTSLNGSVRKTTSEIVGPMRFQLVARSPEGFDERVLAQVQDVPGVAVALPVLQHTVNLVGAGSERTVDLLGADPRLASHAGPLVRRFSRQHLVGLDALGVPSRIAGALGVSSLGKIHIQVGGATQRVLVAAMPSSEIGALADSPIALAPLHYMQSLTGTPGRITSVFVRPRAGAQEQVRAGLARIAAAHTLNLRPADFEATVFSQAASATNDSTLLFSAISALVGFLFAFNAMLLTASQRRDLVEDLRLDGYTASMVVRILLFDALVLGVVGSLAGLALGELLSVELFHASPGYLSLGFPVGSQRIVTLQSVAIALLAGMLAAVVGVLAPLRAEILSPLPAALSSTRRPSGSQGLAAGAGIVCVALTAAILHAAPQAALLGIVSLIAGLLLLLGPILSAAVSVFAYLGRTFSGASTYLALIELRSRENRARALAIAATGAIAVFGSVAIQGAHANLQRGLDRLVHQLGANTQLWLLPGGELNLLASTPFGGVQTAPLTRLAGVRSVEAAPGGMLDYRDRRVWVLGAPPGAAEPIPPSQLVEGHLGRAAARIHEGGWAAVSQALASEHHLHLGQSFVLPSPRPTALRVAALITNLGWPPGAVIMSSADYFHAWASTDPSAYYVHLSPGADASRVRSEIQTALGPGSGLAVEEPRQRELRQRSASRQGLSRLTQISWLVLIAAVLAMGTAMGSMILQRRAQLADLKVDGFRRGELWRALVVESAMLLGTGCIVGAVFGVFGQVLLSHALATVTGFPVVFSADASIAVWSVLIVTGVAVTIVAVPGHLASRARPAVSLQE